MSNITTITEYSPLETALLELESKYKGVIFDVSTPKGLKEAKEARAAIRDPRFKIEKIRKELKAPALDYSRRIDAEAKDITARLVAMEDPIDAQIKEEEQRAEREKAEKAAAELARVNGIKYRIGEILGLSGGLVDLSIEQIAGRIETANAIQIDDSFAEFKTEAEDAQRQTIESLLRAEKQKRDAFELEQRNQELLRKQAEMEAELAALRAAKEPPKVLGMDMPNARVNAQFEVEQDPEFMPMPIETAQQFIEEWSGGQGAMAKKQESDAVIHESVPEDVTRLIDPNDQYTTDLFDAGNTVESVGAAQVIINAHQLRLLNTIAQEFDEIGLMEVSEDAELPDGAGLYAFDPKDPSSGVVFLPKE